MRRFKLLFIKLLFIPLFFSCNSNLEECGIQSDLNYKENERTVLNMLYNFSNEGIISTKSINNTSLVIISIDSQKYDFRFEPIKIQTRSSVIDREEVVLYTVNFKKGNKNGFSIISSDERCQYVYAYTENGSIKDTSIVKPLKKVIDNIPNI